MTSTSGLGNTNITLQFDLNRNIDAAARDVQAAINAARGQLPANLPNNPSYRKVNPADAPIMLLSLTSETVERAHMYDIASSILQQRLAQLPGVGQVNVGGGALPAVRVDVNPMALNKNGLSMEDVRTALAAANANRPKGSLHGPAQTWSITTSDQLLKAADYVPLVIRYQDGAALRLGDVARVTDSWRTSAPAASPTASPPSSSSSTASPARTSSRPWTASARCCRSSRPRSRPR